MKKRWFALLLAGLLAWGLAACGEQETPAEETAEAPAESAGTEESAPERAEAPDAVTTLALEVSTESYQYWDPEYGDYVSRGQGSFAVLRGEDKTEHPSLADALNHYRQEGHERLEAAYGELEAEARSDRKAAPDSFYGPYFREQSVEIHRADTVAVSLLTVGEQYEGGMHGWGFYGSAVFDTETGRKLALTDVIADMDAFTEALVRQVTEQCPEVEETTLREYVAERLADPETGLVWTLGYQGVTVYFAADEVASHAAGPIQAAFSFGAMPELFEPEYTAVPEKYAVPLSVNSAFPYDFTGEGTFTDVEVSTEIEGYEMITSAIVTVGEERCEQETFGYSLTPTLIHMGEGQDYLYAEAMGDNDYRYVQVFDLSGGTASFVGSYEQGGFHTSDYRVEDALTDPDAFTMDTHLDVLGTAVGTKPCHVGADGMPEAETDYYTMDRTVTAKAPVTVTLLDEAGAVTEETKEYPAGTEFAFLRTDGSTYADLKAGDGQECRVTVDMTDWPQTVNGTDVEELFDGVVFAG